MLFFQMEGNASEYGQIGDAISKSSTTDLNTLVTTGIYHCTVANNGLNYNHPLITSSGGALVRVYKRTPYVFQVWKSLNYGIEFTRFSSDSGASWKQWQPVGGSFDSGFIIYISKSGNDLNTGLDNAHPVLTINRALDIVKTLYSAKSAASITFCIGEGNWGNLNLSGLPYALLITDYSNSETNTYSETYPVFDSITLRNCYVIIRNSVITTIQATYGGIIYLDRYIRTSSVNSNHFSHISVNSVNTEIIDAGSRGYVFLADYHSAIAIPANIVVTVIENITLTSGFVGLSHGSIMSINRNNPFTVAEGVTVTGRKYNLYRTTDLWVYDEAGTVIDTFPGNTPGSIAVGARINGVPYGGDSDAALMGDRTWKPVLLQTGGTLTGKLNLRGNNLDYNTYMTNIDVTETPSKTTGSYFRVYDKNNQPLSAIGGGKNASGRQYAELTAYWGHGDSLSTKSIMIYVDANGNAITECPSPASNSNTTTIATTEWVNTKLSDYLPSDGNATTATKANQLTTARTIDGVSFNGTRNIIHFGTCSTAAATAAKVVSCTGFTLATGAEITVQFTVTNSAASPTLNVNNTGAKAITYRNAAISAKYLAANRVYKFVYDGTNYELIGDVNTDTNTDTKVTQTVTTTNAEYALLAMADAAATATKTNGARFSSDVTLNPSTKTITANIFKGNLSGNATTASSISNTVLTFSNGTQIWIE